MVDSGDVLVTGTASGLGKHCREFFRGTAFSREAELSELMKIANKKPFRAIIHSAFNTKSDIDASQLYSYLQDTTFLTKKLLQIPHEKFIFISSTDVYPKDDALHAEDELINVKNMQDIYGISKLMSESIIQNEASNSLILRPTALLGPYARPNSLIKMLTQENPSMTLAGNSTFNYILHKDLSDFINTALMNDLVGIYNLAAVSNIQLENVSQQFNRPITFGNYVYQTGNINNQKAAGVLDNFKNTSLMNINLFRKEIKL
jgi:nucleoside-diphosphate-sugar epimerase